MNEENKKTILLVEDEAITAKVVNRALDKCGYGVIHADSGEKALELIVNNNEIDLVLMDINLGDGIDGSETAIKILEIRSLPVVFLSSHAESEIVEKTGKIASYGYVIKNSGISVIDITIKMAFKLFSANEKNRLGEELLLHKNKELARANSELQIAVEKLARTNEGLIFANERLVESEKNARSNETLYRTLFNLTPVAVGLTRLDDGRIMDVNESYADTFGMSRNEIIGKTTVELGFWVNSADRETVKDDLAKYGEYRNRELRFVVRGEVHPSLQSARVIDLNGTKYIIGITHDISAQKKAEAEILQKNEELKVLNEELTSAIEEMETANEELNATIEEFEATNEELIATNEQLTESEKALEQSETLYRTLFNLTPVIVGLTRLEDGTLVDVNDAYLDISGFTREEVIGKTSISLGFWENEEDYRRIREDLLSQGGFINRELRYSFKHRKKIHDTIQSARVVEIMGNKYVVAVTQDITDRKKAENEKRVLEERLQRAEKMEALGLLAGGVAHDLNNALGIVAGYAELVLMNSDKTSPFRPDLMNIMNGSMKAAEIVQDLLTMARRGVAGRNVLNLNKIVVDFQHSPEFRKIHSLHPGLKIKTDIEADLLNISGSPVHLGKILYNLVLNAGEAMHNGGEVVIKTANRYLDKPIEGYDVVREGDYVILAVSDTGEGIPASDIKRIFEPFYTKKFMGKSGTGLGLSIVWGTVKDHNGYINVESEVGKGTTFTLYFPVTRSEISREVLPASMSEYMGSGEAVLVVDDIKEQRELAALMLKKLNYNVTSVCSGEEALAYMKNNRADIMVLDMIMDPGIDGLDTYRGILEHHPGQKAVIVSGFSESERVAEAQKLGAGVYVKKPYIMERLGLAIKEELERR